MLKAPVYINIDDFIKKYTKIVKIDTTNIQQITQYVCDKVWKYVLTHTTRVPQSLSQTQKEYFLEACEVETASYLKNGGDMLGELGTTLDQVTISNADLDSKSLCVEAQSLLQASGLLRRALC